MSSLCLHTGAKVIEPEALDSIETPEPTATWQPVAHNALVRTVRAALTAGGAIIAREEHALYREGARYFGLLHIQGEGGIGNLVVGVRNSHDQTFPVALSLGFSVFVCDNLSFSGDVTVARKHTRHIGRDLDRLVHSAVGRLSDLRGRQELRFDAYRGREMGDVEAHDLIIRAMQAKVIGCETVPKVVSEWHEPKHEDFRPRNAWSLFNSFTELLKGIRPTESVRRTMTLHGLMDNYCNLAV